MADTIKHVHELNKAIESGFDPFLLFAKKLTNSATNTALVALTNIIGQKINIRIPFITVYNTDERDNLVNLIHKNINKSELNIIHKIEGGFNGFVIFHFTKDHEDFLKKITTKDTNTSVESDLIPEIVNISVNNYFDSLANLLEEKINLTQYPLTGTDSINNLIDFLPHDSAVLCFVNYFFTEDQVNFGSYTVFIEKDSFTKLLKKQNVSTILLVDDSHQIRSAMKKIFIRSLPNVVIDEAQNGLEAIGMHRKNNYDLIIMDVTMPILDGLTASRKILESDHNAKIIMFSTTTDQNTVVNSIKMGVKDFITKQTSKERIINSVKNQLER